MPGKHRKSLNNKKKRDLCSHCKTEVLESDDALECDICNKKIFTLSVHN